MPSFSGGNGAFTPATNNDNYTLDMKTVAGAFGRVTAFGWGGRLTTSTGYRTRWTRATALATGAATTISLVGGQGNPNYATPAAQLVSTFATTQPTLTADPGGNLHAQDWNAQGGLGEIILPLAQPWWIVANVTAMQQFSCRNVAGTDANGSSYHVTWQED